MGSFGVCVVVVGVLLSLVISTVAQGLCPGDLTNKVTKFETQNLICKQYSFPRPTPYVIWALRDNATQVYTMVVSMPLTANRWSGLAFSADGQMVGSSALIASLSSSGAPIINQYYLIDRTPAGVKKGGTGIVFYQGSRPDGYYDQATSTVYMSYQVDSVKSTAKANYFLMAYGSLRPDGSPDTHEDKAYYSATFVSGVVAGESVASKLEKKGKTHGLLQIVGWGVLLPIGALIARYARAFDPAWFYIHAIFQLIGFACIVAGVITGLELAKTLQPEHLDAHRGLGAFLFILATLQVLAVVLRPKKDAKVRKYWNWYHAGVGRFALCLAVINIFLGLTIAKAEDHFKAGYIAIASVMFIVFIVLEVCFWLKWRRQQPARRQQPNEDPPAFQFGGSV